MSGNKGGPSLDDPEAVNLTMMLWDVSFADCDDHEVQGAVIAHLNATDTSSAFWPTPGRIKSMMPRIQAEKLLAESSEDEAADAWGTAREWARRGGDYRPDRNGILQRDQEPNWHDPKHRDNPKGMDSPVLNPDAFAAAVHAVGWMSMVRDQTDRMAQTNGNTFRKAYNYHRKRKAAGDLQLSSKDAGKVLSMIGAKRLEKKK